MTTLLPRVILIAAAALALSAPLTLAAAAEEVEVRMLDNGAAGMMAFEPAGVQIQPGDTVRFGPVDKGYNAESIDGMVPEAAQPFEGKRDEEIVVTFEDEAQLGD